jgi:IclR family transcriptional regulator, mhp operon transcriptional activator
VPKPGYETLEMPQVKSINALARGLDVLQILQSSGAASLTDLHRATGFPKASLLRILKTLMLQGMVWKRMADNAYVPSFSLSELAGKIDRENELVEVAAPILRALSDEVKWPSVLAAPRLTHMEVIETNASQAGIDDVPLGPVGFQINMLRSASGRAFIAYCKDAIRIATLERMRLSRRPGDRWAKSDDYVETILRDTRRQGFALRDLDFGGNYDEGRVGEDDKRDSMGAAIRLEQDVPGAINITWSRKVYSRQKAISVFSTPLLDAARDIASGLSKS